MPSWTPEKQQRLDAFLAATGAYGSRVKATEAVRSGLVKVNGRIARKGALVVIPGDQVEASESDEPMTEELLKATDLKLEVLYEDDACLVISKPAGISVHPAPGIPKDVATVLHGAAFLFKKRKIPFSQSAVLVHRLDKETTGCLLLAKSLAAHQFLQKQFSDRTVEKQYLAIVAGVPTPPSAMIDAPIGRDSANRTKMAVFHAVSRTREAKTTYRTLGVSEKKDAALLELDLHTGRTHQVRVHLKTIGYPVLGDPTYETRGSIDTAARYDIDALMLHAWKLRFVSPEDEKEHAVKASIPDHIKKPLKELGIAMP